MVQEQNRYHKQTVCSLAYLLFQKNIYQVFITYQVLLTQLDIGRINKDTSTFMWIWHSNKSI